MASVHSKPEYKLEVLTYVISICILGPCLNLPNSRTRQLVRSSGEASIFFSGNKKHFFTMQ